VYTEFDIHNNSALVGIVETDGEARKDYHADALPCSCTMHTDGDLWLVNKGNLKKRQGWQGPNNYGVMRFSAHILRSGSQGLLMDTDARTLYFVRNGIVQDYKITDIPDGMSFAVCDSSSKGSRTRARRASEIDLIDHAGDATIYEIPKRDTAEHKKGGGFCFEF